MIKKAVFPVAGLGTRFLPATKANPKEMLPIVDKPLIQYAVEEAINAGVTELIFVTSYSKRAIEDHFDANFELESKLEARNKYDVLDMVQNIIPEGVSCAYVRQPHARGLGDAVLCAQPLVGDEPFAVILADDLIDYRIENCLQRMTSVFENHQSSVLAVEEVPQEDTQRYGIVDVEKVADHAPVKGIVEKPSPERAPSNYAVVGRYILTPQIFNILTHTKTGTGGEVQLTDAISELMQTEKVFATTFNAERFDCGSKLGYLQATVSYALKHSDVGEDFKNYLILNASTLLKDKISEHA